jgi:hypothetical protein
MGDKSFLDDALNFCGQEARHFVADALACHLHNTGYQLEGNTQDTDVEWFARVIAQRVRSIEVPGQWDMLPPGVKESYRETARAVIDCLPALQQRMANRLISLSKIMADISRIERERSRSAAPRKGEG